MFQTVQFSLHNSVYHINIKQCPVFGSYVHKTLSDPSTGCNRRNGPDFGRVFLMLKYTEKPQNTYIQSSTVTEIEAREKCGLLWCLRTVLSVTSYSVYLGGMGPVYFNCVLRYR